MEVAPWCYQFVVDYQLKDSRVKQWPGFGSEGVYLSVGAALISVCIGRFCIPLAFGYYIAYHIVRKPRYEPVAAGHHLP